MTASPAAINREKTEQICSQQMVGQSSHGSIAMVCRFKQSLCRCWWCLAPQHCMKWGQACDDTAARTAGRTGAEAYTAYKLDGQLLQVPVELTVSDSYCCLIEPDSALLMMHQRPIVTRLLYGRTSWGLAACG